MVAGRAAKRVWGGKAAEEAAQRGRGAPEETGGRAPSAAPETPKQVMADGATPPGEAPPHSPPALDVAGPAAPKRLSPSRPAGARAPKSPPLEASAVDVARPGAPMRPPPPDIGGSAPFRPLLHSPAAAPPKTPPSPPGAAIAPSVRPPPESGQVGLVPPNSDRGAEAQPPAAGVATVRRRPTPLPPAGDWSRCRRKTTDGTSAMCHHNKKRGSGVGCASRLARVCNCRDRV